MGCYDGFGKIQIKAGQCLMRQFKVGDKVGPEFEDGAYVGYEGVAVIKKGIFVAEFNVLFDKYGGGLDLAQVVNPDNPIYRAEQIQKCGSNCECKKNKKKGKK